MMAKELNAQIVIINVTVALVQPKINALNAISLIFVCFQIVNALANPITTIFPTLLLANSVISHVKNV
jgi:hypothetical protein